MIDEMGRNVFKYSTMSEFEPRIGEELAMRCHFGGMPVHQRVYTLERTATLGFTEYSLTGPTAQALKDLDLRISIGYAHVNPMGIIETMPWDILYVSERELRDPRWVRSTEFGKAQPVVRPFKREEEFEALVYRTASYCEASSTNPGLVPTITEAIKVLKNSDGKFGSFDLKPDARARIVRYLDEISSVGIRNKHLTALTDKFNLSVLSVLDKLSEKEARKVVIN